jgi:uncharacterized protein with GYD domain
MKLAVLATATDDAARSEHEESERFGVLTKQLERSGARISEAWALLGPHDYLMILDVDGEVEQAFSVMSVIAQSGTMRTESFVAMPLTGYFTLAASVTAAERPSSGASSDDDRGGWKRTAAT